MTKPILWLGPIEEIDAEYDPLLGRSAREVAAQTSVKTSAPMPMGRSVFDDERDVDDAAIAPLSISTPDVTTMAPQPQTRNDDNTLPRDNVPELEPTAETVDASTTNTSDTNEALAVDDEPPEETARPSLLNRFFGRMSAPVAPSAVAAGRSINDIWAKPEPEPEPEPDPEPRLERVEDLERGLVTEDGKDSLDAFLTVENEASHVVDRVDDVVPDADPSHTPVSGDEGGSVSLETGLSTEILEAALEEPIHNQTDALEPIFENGLADVAEPDQTPDTMNADVAVDPASKIDVTAPDVGALEAPSKTTSAPHIEAAPSQIHPFQNAFNAEGFWKLENNFPGNNQPPETNVDGENSNLPPIVEEISSPVEDQIVAPLPIEQPSSAPAEEIPIGAIRPKTSGAPPSLRKRKKKAKKSYVGAFLGTFFFGTALIMTLVSSFAAFGYPWDLLSSYRWYWVILAVVSAGIFGITRGWIMVVASFAVMGLNLFVTVPASGHAPVGGKMAEAVIGWANVSNSPSALARMFADADKRQATLMMIAEAPQSALTPPSGWNLIEAPVANDPTAIAVYSKGSWRAATVPGEPTMARPPAGDITIIGVHPQDAQKSRRSTPVRDALINRAGTRAGIQTGPTIVLGDFNAAPWDRAMRQFKAYGNVTRVRCGGWAGGTYTQAFGLVSVATDHAFVRDVKVTHCRLGGTLPASHHKPIWLYVAPEIAASNAPGGQ